MHKRTHTALWRARQIGKKRVIDGVNWLNRHAPAGWQRNMFQIYKNGDKLMASPRFNNARNAQDVICLAFESVPQFSGDDGRMSCHIIAKYFKIDLTKLGFMPDREVESKLLDEIWLEAMTSYAQPRFSEYVHGAVESEVRLDGTIDGMINAFLKKRALA